VYFGVDTERLRLAGIAGDEQAAAVAGRDDDGATWKSWADEAG
jgi:hypothetical protein